MPNSPIDSTLYGHAWSDARVTALYADEQHVQCLLEVEAALARAQGKLGVIPASAANEIDAACKTLEVDPELLRAGIEHDGFPIMALVTQLRAHVSSEAANAVHFGATTQDIMDTASVLQTRAALKIIRQALEQVISSLARLANRHRDTLMAGRTHTQHALPITFGFKVAGWLAPLVRHHERLQELEKRVLVVQFGGAVGTLAALGDRGLEVQHALARELHLHEPLLPWHTQRDSIAELASWLSMLTVSLGKVAQDVLLLAQSEIAELRESNDTSRGGSSTMPQKSNPITSELILTAARMNATLVSGVHHAMIQEHERGTHGWQLEWHTLPQMMALTCGALENALRLSGHLVVNETRMLENVQASHGLMLAEALSFALAEHMPRDEAKKLSASIAREALAGNRHLIEVARAHVTVPLDWDALTESQYLGSSAEWIARVLEAAERISRA